MANTKITTNVIADDAVGSDQLASGLTLGGNTTFTGHVDLADSKYVRLGADADFIIYHDGTSNYVQAAKQDSDIILRGNDGGTGTNMLTMDTSAAGHATFNAGVTVGGNIANTSGDMLIDVVGDLTLDADGGDIYFSDAGSIFAHISNVSSDLILKSFISDKDILIQGNDGGTQITALTLDMSEGGNATFAGDVIVNKYLRLRTTDDQAQQWYLYTHTDDTFRINYNGAGNDAIVINTSENITINGEVTFNDDIGLGMNGASFGSGVPTINFKGTSNANTRAGAIIFKENNNDDVAVLYVTDGSDTYGTVLAAYQGDIKFSTGTLAGYKMTVKSDGKVGIGTTNPTQKLTLQETHANGAVKDTLRITTTGTYSSSNSEEAGAAISFGQFHNTYPTWQTGLITGIRDGNNWNGSLAFYTNTGSSETSITEKMRIDSNGKVGIGTTGPTHMFHVVDGNNYAVLGDTQSNSTMSLRMADSALRPVEVQAYGSELRFNTASSDNATPSVKMTITSDGTLLVGTTNTSGESSNAKRVKAGIFQTVSGATACAHSTATTLLSLPGGLGTYIVSIGFSGVGNTAAYSSCGIVHGDGTSYKLTVLTTSTAMTLSISGSDIKGTQGSGATLNISWSMIRIQ